MTRLNKREKLVKGPLVLYEQMRLKVLDLIRERDLKAHDPIPSEGELADMFGVSRRTSKEALSMLAKEKVVYRLPRRGTFLSEASTENPHYISKHSLAKENLLTLAIVVPSLDEFTGQIVSAALQEAHLFNCELLVRVTGGNHEAENEILRDLGLHKLAQGIIYFPGDRMKCGSEVLKLHVQGFPIVLIDRVFKEITIPSVYHDHFEGAYALASHLISQGHRQIGVISEPISGVVSREERYHGFLKAMTEHQLPFSSQWLFEGMEWDSAQPEHHLFSQESLQRLQAFLQRSANLSAMLCFNDHLALACLHSAISTGIKVPEQLSITGFTDLSLSAQAIVPLTTMRKSPDELGKQAIAMLRRYLSDPSSQLESIRLNPELIIRKSVKRL